MPDHQLIDPGTRELEQLRIVSRQEAIDGTVVRMRRADPIHDAEYKAEVQIIQDYLELCAEIPSLARKDTCTTKPVSNLAAAFHRQPSACLERNA